MGEDELLVAIDGLTTEQVIERSIIVSISMGVRIVRGPLFIWSPNKTLPDACDCFGAVLIAHNKAFRDFPAGWLKELCFDILHKDYFWFRRFDLGFNRLTTTYKYRTDCFSGIIKLIDDDVSPVAIKLSKKYVASD